MSAIVMLNSFCCWLIDWFIDYRLSLDEKFPALVVERLLIERTMEQDLTPPGALFFIKPAGNDVYLALQHTRTHILLFITDRFILVRYSSFQEVYMLSDEFTPLE